MHVSCHACALLCNCARLHRAGAVSLPCSCLSVLPHSCLARTCTADPWPCAVQMPRGVPVATVAIGNATNAGLLAVRTLAASRPSLLKFMQKFQGLQQEVVEAKAARLEADGWQVRRTCRHLAPVDMPAKAAASIRSQAVVYWGGAWLHLFTQRLSCHLGQRAPFALTCDWLRPSSHLHADSPPCERMEGMHCECRRSSKRWKASPARMTRKGPTSERALGGSSEGAQGGPVRGLWGDAERDLLQKVLLEGALLENVLHEGMRSLATRGSGASAWEEVCS